MKRLLFAVLLGMALPAAAQYPNRTVTMLTGYPAGGLVDIVARMVAENMKPRFPAGLVVVNRPGAAGAVAVGELTRAAPDGYTIILTPHSALTIAPQINDLPYKTPDDYDPFINLVAYYPLIAVRTESKYKTIRELLSDAKDNPGMLRVGTPGEGTSSHLNLEELMHHAGVKMVHVPFAGWAQSSVAVLGGHLEGQVDREAIGVVQRERLVARERAATRLLHVLRGEVEDLGAGLERLAERLLLGVRHP